MNGGRDKKDGRDGSDDERNGKDGMHRRNGITVTTEFKEVNMGLEFAGTPDGGMVGFEEFAGVLPLTESADRAVFHDDGSGDVLGVVVGVSEGGEGGGPGDVAMAGGVVSVAAFGENPFRAGVNFAEGEEVGGDVVMVSGEVFLGGRELVHDSEAEVVLSGGEVHFLEPVGALVGGFPANLAAES